MIKNIRSATGLSNITVPIIDTSSNSSNYFRLFNIPDKFYVGRNGFNIQGNLDTLVKDSMIYIDIIDSTGKVIFHEIYDFLSADKSRLISVYIYDDTPPGECMIYVAGRAKINPTTGQSYPYSMNPGSPDYLDNPNLLWSKKILVVPNKENTQDLVFKAVPKVTAEERILSYYEFSSDPQTRKLNISGSWDVSTTTTYQNYTKGSDSKFAPDIGTVGDINTYDPDITDSTKYTSKQEVYSYYSNNIARLTDTQSNFTPDHVGGVITLRNLANTPELSKLVNDGVITSVPDFSASIVSVEDANTIQISPSFQFIYNTSAGKQVVRSITNVSNVTASYFSNASSSLISQESQSYVKLDFDKLEPVVGDVDYVDISYKPFGSVGDFQDLGKHTLSPQEYLLSQDELVFDKFSLKLKPIGEFLTKTDFTNYWDLTNGDYSSTVSTDTKFIKSGVKLLRGVSQGTSIGYDYKISPKSSYGISATEETEFELSFDLNSRVGNGTVSAYISGSGIISDEIDSRNVDSVITDRSLGELVGVVTNSSTASTTTHKFYFRVIDSNIIYPIILFKDIDSINIRNISVKPRNVPGYSPNQARIILPLSTFDIQTELVFRFNYHTAVGLKSDTSTKLYGVYFKGTGLRPSVLNNSLPSSSIYTDLSSSFLDASGSFSDRITSLEVSGGGGTGNWDDITGKPDGLLSSSAQIASDISGAAFVSASNEFEELTLTKGSGETTVLDLSPKKVLELVKNKETQTLPKGTPVYVSGSAGNAAHVYAASASRADRMPAAYVLNEELEYDQEGYGIVIGFINGVNTSAFNEGDNVYVGINGGYTNVKPTGNSNRIQKLGNVIKVHATNGSGVITGAGRSNDVPNIQRGYIWVGGTDDVSYQLPTSSLLLKYDNYIDSTDARLDSLETYTGSADTRFDGLDTYTGSADTRFDGLDTYTGSADTRFDGLDAYTGSADTRFDGLDTYTGSADTRFDGLDTYTGSADTRFDGLDAYTGSADTRFDGLDTYTGSADTRFDGLDTYTGSADTRFDGLDTYTGSADTRFDGLDTFTGSIDNRVTTLEGKTLISGSEQIADEISGSSPWETNGSDIYPKSTYKYLGVGTTNPTRPLDVRTDEFLITQFYRTGSGNAAIKIQSSAEKGWYLQEVSNGNFAMTQVGKSFGKLVIQSSSIDENVIYIDSDNDVGIGTASPTNKLDVNGNVNADSYTGSLDWSDLDNVPNLISGSEQIADEISGSSPWHDDGSRLLPKNDQTISGSRIDIQRGDNNLGLHIKGSSSGGALARFQRNVGATGIVDILFPAHDPQMRFNRENSGDQFTIGVDSTGFKITSGSSLTSGGDLVTVTPDGRVGIGTNTPDADYKVDISGSGFKLNTDSTDGGLFVERSNSNASTYIHHKSGQPQSTYNYIGTLYSVGQDSSNNFQISYGYLGTLNRFTINPSGDIGIGTSTPDSKLEIQDGHVHTDLSGLSGAAGRTAFQTTVSSDNDLPTWIIESDGAGVADRISIYSNDLSTAVARIAYDQNSWFNEGGGNFGIGTSSPLSSLHVEGASTSAVPTIEVRDSDSDHARLRLRGPSNTTIWDIRNEMNYTWDDRGSGVTTHYDDVDTYVWRNNAGTEQMRKNASGNLGIGTSSNLNDQLTVGNSTDGFTAGVTSGVITTMRLGAHDVTGAAARFDYDRSTGTLTYKEGTYNSEGNALITVKNNGDTGFGETSPNRTVEITNTGAAYEAALEINSNSDLSNWARLDLTNVNAPSGGFIFYQDNGGKAGIRNLSTDRITYVVDDSSAFHAWEIGSGTERMRLNSTGLGIGTTNPSQKLHVDNGNLLVTQSTTNTRGVKISSNGEIDQNNSSDWLHLQRYQNGLVAIGNDSTSNLYVANSLGIGTTSPSQKLDVRGRLYLEQSSGYGVNIRAGSANSNDGANILIDDNATMAAGVGGSISFRGLDGSTQRSFAFIKGGKENATSSNFDGYLSFHTRQNSQPDHDEGMRITSTGNVGIGTTSPSVKLDVVGEFKLNSATSSTGRFLKSIDANGLSNWADITMADITDKYWTDGGTYLIPSNNEDVLIDGNGVGTLPSYQIRETTAGRIWHMGVPVANEFQIGYGANVSSNPVMRFDASGNVGIGTSSPTDKFDVFSSSNNQRLIRISHPTAPTQAAGFLGFNTDGAIDNNVVTLGVQYSSTYYNTINIQRSTRNVGIGITSPLERFVVSGGNIQLRGTTYTDFTDYWGSSDNSAIFTPYGFIGSSGAYAMSIYSNGYRTTTGFSYMDGGSTAAGIDLMRDGDIYFRQGTASGTVLPLVARIENGDFQTESGDITAKDGYVIKLAPSPGGAGPEIQFGTSATSNLYMTIGAYASINNIDNTDRDLRIYGDGNQEYIYADYSTGNVGIGTSSPSVRLHAKSSTLGTLINDELTVAMFEVSGGNRINLEYSAKRLAAGSNWYNTEQKLSFNIDENASKDVWIKSINATSTTDNVLAFGEGTSTEWMRIDNGNVAIGTNDPLTNKLRVYGGGNNDGVVRIDATDAATYVWATETIAPNLSSNGSVIHLFGLGTSNGNSAYVGFKYIGSGNVNNRMTFGHYGANHQMVLNYSGDLGIGTETPAYKLDVNDTITRPAADMLVGQMFNSDYVGFMPDTWASGQYAFMASKSSGHAYASAEAGSNLYLRAGGNNTANEIILTSSGITVDGNTTFEDNVTFDTIDFENSNLMKFSQIYYGNSTGSYFTSGEYQKVFEIIPDGNAQNYEVNGEIIAQSGLAVHVVRFHAALRSETLPNLSWATAYDEEYTNVPMIVPEIWTKETTTAGFIIAFGIVTGTIYGNVTCNVNVIPRTAAQKTNVTFNTSQSSEQSSVDAGYTDEEMVRGITKSSSGKIGINKLKPSASLHVEGDALISSPGYFGAPLLKVQRDDIDSYFSVSADSSDLTMIVSGNGARDFVMGYDYTADGFIIEPGTAYTSTPSLFVKRTTGNLGIGTESPSEKLDVLGKIRMRTGGTTGYIPVSDSNGVMTWTDPSTISVGSSDEWTRSGGKIYPTTSGDYIEDTFRKRFRIGVGNISPRPVYYRLCTLTSSQGGVHIKGTFGNHVESYGVQTVDLNFVRRENGVSTDMEVFGTVNSAYQGPGIRVVRSTNTSWHEFEIWAVIERYNNVDLTLTFDSNTSSFTYDGSTSTTTAPTGFAVEIDTSTYTEGHYVISDSQIVSVTDTTGIGTGITDASSIAAKLHIVSSNDLNTIFEKSGGNHWNYFRFRDDGTDEWGIGTDGSSNLFIGSYSGGFQKRLGINGTTGLVDITEDLGIGMTPRRRLSVFGEAEIIVDSNIGSGGRMFKFTEPTNNYPTIAARNGDDSGDAYFRLDGYGFPFFVQGTQKMNLSDVGLALGNSFAASYNLDVRESSNSGTRGNYPEILLRNTSTTNSANFARLSVESDNGIVGATILTSADSTGAAFSEAGAYYGTMTAHKTFIGAGYSTAMTVATDGKVGIGTSSPDVAFHMYDNGGSARIQTFSTDIANPYYDLDIVSNNYSTNQSSGLGIHAVQNTLGGISRWSSTFLQKSTSGGVPRTSIGLVIRDATDVVTSDSSDAITIVAGGNVGIGTIAPDKLLVVSGAGSEIAINDTSNEPGLRFRNSGATSGEIVMTNTQDMRFRTGGTSERMRITSTGEVAIGRTTVTSPYQVHIAGDVKSDTKIRARSFETDNVSSRLKLAVWTGSTYAIGMQNSFTFGPLTNNYAMTFQMSNTAGRGFWWGDSSHGQGAGSMALDTQGNLVVATSVRVGGGESDTSSADTGYDLDVVGDAVVKGDMEVQGQLRTSTYSDGAKSSAYDLDFSLGNHRTMQATGNFTCTLQNYDGGGPYTILLNGTSTGTYTVTFTTDGGDPIAEGGDNTITVSGIADYKIIRFFSAGSRLVMLTSATLS